MNESEGSVRKNTNEWNKARVAARQRDGGRCVLCSSMEDIEVHHIDYDPDNHVLWNMITLCKKCHTLITKPKSNEESLQLFRYVTVLQTSHFHPNAIIEVHVRHLGGFEITRTVSEKEEMNSIFENSWGMYEFIEDFQKEPNPINDSDTENEYFLNVLFH